MAHYSNSITLSYLGYYPTISCHWHCSRKLKRSHAIKVSESPNHIADSVVVWNCPLSILLANARNICTGALLRLHILKGEERICDGDFSWMARGTLLLHCCGTRSICRSFRKVSLIGFCEP